MRKDVNAAGKFAVDAVVAAADASQFDGLLLQGGTTNPDVLRLDDKAVAFVRAFVEAGKPSAAICHGLWMLINAGGVKGRTLTSWPSLQTDLLNAGATGVDGKVALTVRWPPRATRRTCRPFARQSSTCSIARPNTRERTATIKALGYATRHSFIRLARSPSSGRRRARTRSRSTSFIAAFVTRISTSARTTGAISSKRSGGTRHGRCFRRRGEKGVSFVVASAINAGSLGEPRYNYGEKNSLMSTEKPEAGLPARDRVRARRGTGRRSPAVSASPPMSPSPWWSAPPSHCS